MRAFLEGLAGLELRLIRCQPIPARWVAFHSANALTWDEIPFNAQSLQTVPQVQGVYCFVVGPPPTSLPSVRYPMYVGQTKRTLRQRFQEYLRERDDPAGRYHVRKFLNVFDGELTFMCAQFSGTYQALVRMERDVMDAVMPAYSDRGYSAEVRAGRGAWQ